jgi:hypothetical protein
MPEWQTAADVLMLIGERGGDPMMAHIAMMRALQGMSRKRHLYRDGKRAKGLQGHSMIPVRPAA